MADPFIEHTVIEAARDGGPTLVFLHEGLGSVGLWRDFPAAVAEATGCRAVIYSRRGYGRSDPAPRPWPTTYMHDEAARLPALLTALDVDRPVLIGHSDGASIAIIHTGSGDQPRPEGLVLIAPHVFVEERSIAGIESARQAYETGDLRHRLDRWHADVDNAFWGWNGAWLDPAFRQWNIEGFLGAITCPVLVVQGDADEYGTLAQVDAIERQVAGPVETLVLRGAGHAPHRERPADVLATIGRWMITAWSR